MTLIKLAAALSLGVIATSLGYAPAARADSTVEPPVPVTISQDMTAVSTRIGLSFGFTSTVRNASSQPVTGLVAHLNIVSLDPGVYVDPEDWSSHRTQYLPPLTAHESTPLSWTVQAVNDGHFIVYVAVTAPTAGSPVTAGPALRADVAAQRTINAGGILPISFAVPIVMLVLLLGTRRRRRRLT